LLHAGTQATPLHETVPLAGAVHGELHAVVPQLSIAVLLTHFMAFEPVTPHEWKPVVQLSEQVPPAWQIAVPFGSVGQATQPSPQAVASSFAAQAAPHLW
jgi:hypothetical protein